MKVDLPDRLLQRDNDLIVQVDYTPVNGLCDPGAQQMTVQLDPSSLISGAEGSSLPPGFDRLPRRMTRDERHSLLNRLNAATIALHLLRRQLDAGYADQAHFGREFRVLAGAPAGRLKPRAKGPFA